MTERFFELMEHPSAAMPADRPMLEEMTGHWPWFIPARLLLLRLAEQETDGIEAKKIRNRLALRLMYYPSPPLLLDEPVWDELRRKDSRELIDDFLAVEDKRIVPDDTPSGAVCDLSAAEAGDDEFINETLAEIYAAQGLTERAVAIYRRLSLRFPEKSVTFADRIAGLTPKN